MDSIDLEKILESYREELDEVEKNRKNKSVIRSQMSDEELVEDLEKELIEVLEDASKNGVTIGISPVNNDEKK